MGTNHTSGLAGRSHSIGPTAEPVIDGPDQAVLVDLGPIASALLTDLARALHRSGRGRRDLLILGTLHPSSVEHTRTIAHLVNDQGVRNALQLTLSTGAATCLAEQLDEASLERQECAREACDNLTGHDGLLCDGHHDAADTILRAV